MREAKRAKKTRVDRSPGTVTEKMVEVARWFNNCHTANAALKQRHINNPPTGNYVGTHRPTQLSGIMPTGPPSTRLQPVSWSWDHVRSTLENLQVRRGTEDLLLMVKVTRGLLLGQVIYCMGRGRLHSTGRKVPNSPWDMLLKHGSTSLKPFRRSLKTKWQSGEGKGQIDTRWSHLAGGYSHPFSDERASTVWCEHILVRSSIYLLLGNLLHPKYNERRLSPDQVVRAKNGIIEKTRKTLATFWQRTSPSLNLPWLALLCGGKQGSDLDSRMASRIWQSAYFLPRVSHLTSS